MKATTNHGYYQRLLAALILQSFFTGMQSTTLALYVLHLGGTATHVGVIAGISSAIAVFFRGIFGNLTDTRGRQLTFVFGVSLYIISSLGYSLAPNMIVLIASKVLYGIGMCATTSSMGAILADLLGKDLTRGFYTVGAAQIMGGLIAPTIGIFVSKKLGYPGLYFITMLGFILVFIISLTVNYEKYDKKAINTDNPNPVNQKKISIIEKTAVFPALCMLFVGIAHCSINSFVASYGKTIGIQNVGFFFIVHGLGTLFVRIILGRFTLDKYINRVFYCGIGFFCLSVILFLFSTNAVWIGFAAAVYAVGYSATQPILNSLAMMMAPDERRGAANSTYYMAWDFGFGAGSLALGALASKFGYPAIYMVSVAALIIAVVIYIIKLAPVVNMQVRKQMQ